MGLSKVFTLFFVMVLAGCVAAAPWTLGSSQHKLHWVTGPLYNAKGRITFDPAKAQGNQIGVGVYTTPGPAEWKGNPGDWSSTVDSIPKVWVPKQYWWNIQGMYTWADKTFTKKTKNFDFDNVLRLSQIGNYEPTKQLLIPTYLLSGKGMDLKVTCKANWKDLPSNKPVDYSKWRKVLGIPQ
ncbi:hypothetical protein K456DRAFT_1721234 [Colletotrichum gloeosporioides 23]|nr:hypothetical protein K456DRAFT_1721234 [Colletotrichum gloeosporioides 23]